MTGSADLLARLESALKRRGSCLVAYSGGVDSTFLLAAAERALGDRCLAVTVNSLFTGEKEISEAVRRAAALGARHRVIDLDLSGMGPVLCNPPDRCYHCKKAIFSVLQEVARKEGLSAVVEASHLDDLRERRPGLRALEELAVESPLRVAGFTKKDIREYSKKLGVEGADRYPGPCLATRVPYGRSITPATLERLAKAEEVLIALGFSAPRLRDYGDTARIELRDGDMAKIADRTVREALTAPLKKLGYTYITVDLEGYRSGSMDEVLEEGRVEG